VDPRFVPTKRDTSRDNPEPSVETFTAPERRNVSKTLHSTVGAFPGGEKINRASNKSPDASSEVKLKPESRDVTGPKVVVKPNQKQETATISLSQMTTSKEILGSTQPCASLSTVPTGEAKESEMALHPGTTAPSPDASVDEDFDEEIFLTDETLPPSDFDDLEDLLPQHSRFPPQQRHAFVPKNFVDNRIITPPIGVRESAWVQKHHAPDHCRTLPQHTVAGSFLQELPNQTAKMHQGPRSFMPPPPPPLTPPTPIPTHSGFISQKDIEESIPETASAVFHILDRRVNLDAHSSWASLYSLLRSWVQDDPHRQIPPPGANLVDYRASASGPSCPLVQTPVLVNSGQPQPVVPEHSDAISIVRKMARGEVPPDIVCLRNGLVKKARRAKNQKQKRDAKGLATVRASLERKGITLPKRVTYSQPRSLDVFPR
jgi:hypothetical protein